MRVRRVVDLSHTVGAMTPVYPGDPEPSVTPVATIAADGYNLAHVAMGSQSGTHADAPFHFDDAGTRVDAVPLEVCCGPGVIVDVIGLEPRQPIVWSDLAPTLDGIPPGTIVLLRTGWSLHYGTPTYFDHPYLAGDAAEILVRAGVRCVGIDAPNLDETPDATHPGGSWPVHRTFAAADGVLVENLCRLEEVDFVDPLISVLPLKLDGADGAPVRAAALEISVAGDPAE
ncbi:cyclase family protein [Spiractinospora alimapuensis]|uniref:cyclase family protein n=1 Tax=Spiractinospora alimapuensis TaxID=2820884 RepID=UPI001F2F0EB6|nr:cyclase family protein [Spiractinospora alimapuensis]QVQ52047.1 cyclase family protein [Spiractinospora alimapuensis]